MKLIPFSENALTATSATQLNLGGYTSVSLRATAGIAYIIQADGVTASDIQGKTAAQLKTAGCLPIGPAYRTLWHPSSILAVSATGLTATLEVSSGVPFEPGYGEVPDNHTDFYPADEPEDWVKYVDSGAADDTGAGTVGDPWKTVVYAMAQAALVTTGDGCLINCVDATFDEPIYFIHDFTVPVVIKGNESTPTNVVFVDTSDAVTNSAFAPAGTGDATIANLEVRGVHFSTNGNSNTHGLILYDYTLHCSGAVVATATFRNCKFTTGNKATGRAIQLDNRSGDDGCLWNLTFVDCEFDSANADGTPMYAVDMRERQGLIETLNVVRCQGSSMARVMRVDGCADLYIKDCAFTSLTSTGMALAAQRNPGSTDYQMQGIVDRLKITTTGDHALIMGSNKSTDTGLKVRRCDLAAAGHCIVVRDHHNGEVSGCKLTEASGTVSPVLFKGAYACKFFNNTITADAQTAIDNYDGAATFITSDLEFFNNVIICGGSDTYMDWEIAVDGGGNRFYNNVWQQTDTAKDHFEIGATTVELVADLEAAFVAQISTDYTDTGIGDGSVEGTAELQDSVDGRFTDVPTPGGNCDLGNGTDAGLPVGALDYYGRALKVGTQVPVGAVSPAVRR